MRKLPALVILFAGVILVKGTSLELINAAKYGFYRDVPRLIEQGVDVNGVDIYGYSALMHAAMESHLGIVNILIGAGANVNHQGIEVGHTALHLATMAHHTQIVSSLLEAGADPGLTTHSKLTVLHLAALNGCSDIASMLIAKNANVHLFNNDGESALTEAARYGHTTIVQQLLDNGVDVNALSPNGGRDISPLMRASQGGHAGIVKLLLDRGALVNHVSHNVGFSLSNLERIEEKWQLTLGEAWDMLQRNPQLSDLRFTAILVASKLGHTQIVRILASHGADTNAQQFEGMTAMHFAAGNGNNELVAVLIQNKAKIDLVNELGQTPLVLALAKGHFETANLLMAHGADINIKTYRGNTPLSVAADLGFDSLVRNLIYAGAEIPDIIAQDHHAEFIQPLLEPIQQLAGAAENTLSLREVITAWFIRIKADNDALPPQILGGSAKSNMMVSRILKFLVILRIKDASMFYLVAPYLAEADIEQLDRFGSVLAFLTAPMRKKLTILEIGKNELVPFIEKTFNQLITRSAVLGFETIVNRMHAAFVQVDAHFKAVSHGTSVIPEIHLGTVFQYRHGEFGVYSKFADLVATDIN